jgi:hypothetical protein
MTRSLWHMAEQFGVSRMIPIFILNRNTEWQYGTLKFELDPFLALQITEWIEIFRFSGLLRRKILDCITRLTRLAEGYHEISNYEGSKFSIFPWASHDVGALRMI